MIYLDSAATSFQKPPEVYRAADRALREAASPGRGAYGAAMKAADLMLDARECAASFFSFPHPERVVMTMNATHALNLAIRSLAGPGARVVVSGYEHNAVVRPLHACGAVIDVASAKLFNSEELVAAFRKKRPGADREIAALCRDHGVPLIVDASQSAGVLHLDAEVLAADFIAMPGHKSLLGIPGSGLLLCGGEAKPLLYGGSGSDSISREMPVYLPERLDAVYPEPRQERDRKTRKRALRPFDRAAGKARRDRNVPAGSR